MPNQIQNPNDKKNEESNEEEISATLFAEQELNLAQQNLMALSAEGQSYKKPSFLKYSFLFTVAGIVDVVDFLDLTGIGIIIAKIVSIAGSSFAMKSSKFLGKVPGMKGLARKIPRAMVGVRRLARKNPLTKVLIGGAINLVPFLAMINLMIVWIWLTRHDEKKAFKQAREASDEAAEQTSQTIETTQTA